LSRKHFLSRKHSIIKKSPWILHFGGGGCNGCEIELITLFSPRYDVERFGCLLKGSPRHADILLVTGSITKKVKDRLIRIYEQMPNPKVVVAVGTCATSTAPFEGCYHVVGPIDKYIPVDVYVPGCPPKPEAIISGILKAIKKFDEKDKNNKMKKS